MDEITSSVNSGWIYVIVIAAVVVLYLGRDKVKKVFNGLRGGSTSTKHK